jgi:uncharacterized CHY-type Zn-finger protein
MSIAQAIDAAAVCTICGARGFGICDCWTRCDACGWYFERGKSCHNADCHSDPLARWMLGDLSRAAKPPSRIVCGSCRRELTFAEAIEATRDRACPHCHRWPADATAHRSDVKFELGADGWPKVAAKGRV